MSVEENEALARRWIAVWDEGDEAKLDNLYAAEFEYHMRFPGQEAGLAGEKQVVRMLHGAVLRWTMPGTHQGVFRGIQPNGQPVRFTGMDILRIERGKIVARWDEVNNRAAPTYVA